MVSKFERVLYEPLVYQTYSSKNDKTGEVEDFIFKDIVKENYEEAADFMLEYYAKDETFLNAIKVSQDVLREFYLFVFGQNSAVGCFKKGTNELVGVNALSVKTQGVDTSFKSDDKVFMRMRQSFAFINNFFDVHAHNNVIYFLYAHGLAVKTEYRGRGIATELLKVRIPFMRANGLLVTASLFTTAASQKAAFKLGFREDFSISYKVLQQQFPDFDFSSANCDDCKLLSLKIQ